MDNIKTLYTFSVDIEKEVEKIETVVENGQTFEKKGKVKEKVPIRFALKKPRRQEFEDARFFYGVEYSNAITNGFLTKGMMVNKYANTTGGIFSQTEAKELLKLLEKRDLIDSELKQAVSINAEKSIIENYSSQLLALSRQILEIEISNQALFQHTAENRAKEKTVTYMFYCFSYVEQGGRWVPFFDGDGEDPVKKFLQKQARHFSMEDAEDPVLLLVRDRLLNLFAHYYEGVAVTEQDFKDIEDKLSKQFAVQDKNPQA